MKQDIETTSKTSLIRLEEVKQRTGLSRSTIYAYMSENRFPKSIYVSERCVAWIVNEIDAWIENRMKFRKQ